MPIVRLRNTNPLGDVDLALIGREGDNALRAGEEFDIDDELAGCAPGNWRKPTPAEAEEGLVGLVTRTVDPGEPTEHVLVKCPGRGLLAQVGNYEPVKTPRPKPATTTQES